MALTLDQANRITAAAIAKAAELKITVNVAVCDAGGRLIAFQRMDNAIWGGSYGSQGKAIACAAFGRVSGELVERADHPTFRGIREASGGHMIFGQGGVPIMLNGVIEGGVGVGGGTGEEDEMCAKAGVDAIT
ncbi:MAG: heme-binding protein [Pseudomonadota bacterium]